MRKPIISLSIITHASPPLASALNPSHALASHAHRSSHHLAFVSSFPSTPLTSRVKLHAKSASKKKKPAAGGGFGKSSPKKETKAKDPVAYPDLEPSVLQTLISGPHANDENAAGTLGEEIYDRLEDIYGFGKFNFGGEGAIYKSIGVADANGGEEKDAGAAGGSLFDDILKVDSDTDNTLENLFGSSPSAGKTDTSTSANGHDLNLLPPFTKFRVLHIDPMVLAIDDFFTSAECDRYIQISKDSESDAQSNSDGDRLQPMLLGKSRTVGKDSRSQAQRTSTTWFHYYEGVPELMSKACRLLGLEGLERWEEPQTVRYRRNEKFTWHLDALSPEEATNPSGAGQRVATLLVYLTDLSVNDGGATMFRDLGAADRALKVRPKKGSALLFFPSAGGIPSTPFDIRTLHCGEAVSEDAENEKWIAQLWLRERKYAPTAPEGNEHVKAAVAMRSYCEEMKG